MVRWMLEPVTDDPFRLRHYARRGCDERTPRDRLRDNQRERFPLVL